MSARKGSIFAGKELRFLRELSRAGVDYMVVGLSAAALQGAPVVTQDVDLWFRDLADPRISKALKRVGASYLPPVGGNPPVFVGEAVELFDIVTGMHGLGEFEKERKGALKIRIGSFRVPVLPLDRIIKSKKALGRPKDRLYLRVLTDTQAARGRQPPCSKRRSQTQASEFGVTSGRIARPAGTKSVRDTTAL